MSWFRKRMLKHAMTAQTVEGEEQKPGAQMIPVNVAAHQQTVDELLAQLSEQRERRDKSRNRPYNPFQQGDGAPRRPYDALNPTRYDQEN